MEIEAARLVCPAVLRPTQTVRAGVKQKSPPAAIQVPTSERRQPAVASARAQ